MSQDRIHRTTSHDGTEIVARVQGGGPPLVLVHGGLEDGDQCWEAMLPRLRRSFTCYLMSRRGRGSSGGSTDLSPERLVDDVTSVVDSIEGPVGLFGESDGGALAIGAAARSDAVSAVAVYEPTVFDVVDDDTGARLGAVLEQVGAAAGKGRLDDATRRFSELLATEDEIAALTASGYLEESERYLPNLLGELEQEARSDAPGPTHASRLATVTAPVLVLLGARTVLGDWFAAGARHVTEHVPDAEVREVAGAGHFGVVFAPERIADEVIPFLAAAG